VRKLFANSCSWCHGDFGMKEGKGGPKLAGTKMNLEQLKDRITNGKSGSMPGFKKTLKEDQIDALAEYVKGLPAN
jgi:mono/diheme cytochrome c family protein